jgi:peptidyl-prolyl cis-trans isomerase A (cyclophilin A)
MSAALCAQTAAPQASAKKSTAPSAPKAAVVAKKTTPPVEQIPLPAENGLYAVFNTSLGRIIAVLYEKQTPITVKNFADLARGTKAFTDEKTRLPARRPFYNGLTFHRVIPKFMIQGGDPLGNGMGGGGVTNIVDEFDPALTFDKPGILAMANVGRPNTGACQFFITTTGSTPAYLNGRHTIFGQVVVGQEVVDAISEVPRDPADKPLTPVILKTLLIRRVGPDPNAPPTPAATKSTTKATSAPKAAPAAKKTT